MNHSIVGIQGPGNLQALFRAALKVSTNQGDGGRTGLDLRKDVGCRCCGGPSPYAYNCAVRDDVAQELDDAAVRLDLAARDIKVKLLVEGSDPPLEEWVVHSQIDLVLLPAHWRVLRSRSHPAARLLRRATGADVRIVRSRQHQLRPARLMARISSPG